MHSTGVRILLAVMLTSIALQIYSRSQIPVKDESVDNTLKKLECTIIKNYVREFKSAENARRNIWVMMDEPGFSENSLRDLFALLSAQYPEPHFLSIDVITSDAQRPRGHSGGREPPGYYEHHRAVYLRRSSGELFRYTLNPTDRNLKTVELTGNRR